MKRILSVVSKVMVLAMVLGMMTMFTGCRDFDKPEMVTIEPSQSAFMIPLVGKTSDQKAFMSEEFLQNAKISTKQIEIPHRWLKEGRDFLFFETGKYIVSAKLILVERKPETREWTEGEKDGTSSKNEGIVAESKESLGFMSRMNASAQIDEPDAVRFLYRYNSKPLAEIMDSEIRARIESKFVEECAKRTLDDILLNKEAIMKAVREDVIPYFKERGITISVIGMKGEFTYLNPDIQKAIDQKFKSAQEVISQKNENEKVLSKASADAQAVQIQSQSIEKSLQLKQLENQAKSIDKWDGKMPTYVSGDSGNIFNIPIK